MRVLVAGMIAGRPHQGGATWAVLQYVRGLQRLGHEVVVVEPVAEPSPPVLAYFAALGLPRAALLGGRGHAGAGLSRDDVAAFDAELLLNLAGTLRDPELMAPVPTRVYVDLDPVFLQVWHAIGLDVGVDGHTHHATVGRLDGTGLPLDRPWIPTLPPVVLEEWPVAGDTQHDAFTTVGHWRSYGSVEWQGRSYGQKAHAVRRLLELPRLTRHPLLAALAVHPAETADLRALRQHGWHLADPSVLAGTPGDYRRFVSGSKGELGLTKAGYVDSRCGWFSDRSACYLAAGRPVVAHDTAFSRRLPTGDGLVAFSTAAEAAAAIDRVAADYEHHRRAARAVAEEHLDSDRVITRLLERVL